MDEMLQSKDIGQLIGDPNFRSKDIHRLKVRRWKKIFHVNGNDKKLRSSNSKEKREDPMNKVRNERGDLTINIRKIKKITSRKTRKKNVTKFSFFAKNNCHEIK